MDFALPPELTSTMIYTGSGSASLIAAAAAWLTTAEQLDEFAAAHSSVIANVSSVWLGASDAAMRATSVRVVSWAQHTAAQAAQTAASLTEAAGAYETVHATITPPAAVYANRVLLAELVATNVLGQNFPAIAATEAQYSEMWATNIAAMTTYQATSAQATGPLTSFMNLVTSLPGLGSIIAPGSNQATTGLAGLLNLISGTSGSALGSLLNSNLFSQGLLGALISWSPADWLSVFSSSFTPQQNQASSEPELVSPSQLSNQASSQPVATAPSPAARMGAGERVGSLTAPAGWVKPVAKTSVVRSDSTVNISAAAPVVEASGVPLPLPLGGFRAGTPPKQDKPPPEYGQQSTIMPKHPYGG